MEVVTKLDGDLSNFVHYSEKETDAIKVIHAGVIAQIEAIPIMSENTRKTVLEWIDDVFDLREEGAGMFIKDQ